MKNLKKITALVIVLAMALGSVAFAAFTDVAEDASYNEAVTAMAALKLLVGYEDGTFGPDKTITRAEFSAVVVRALGMEDAARGAVTNTRFTDVTADHWASGYVQIANQQGIIAGYGDGTFGPDDEVTYEQAIKMLVCALGYAPKFANVADAYPTAYLAQANTSGITVGAAGKIGDKASRAVVARLVYNALDVPLMEQLSFGSDVEYGIPEKYTTLLANNLKVAKVEGSVDSVSFNKESGNELSFTISSIDEVYEKVSDLTEGTYTLEYADSVTPIKGYTCVAYIDCNEDDEILVALAPKAGKNKTLELTAKQAKEGEIDFTKNELSYFKTSAEVDSKATIVKLDPNVKVFINLNSSEVADKADFATDYAAGTYKEITLIDNNNDNKYDYIYVTEYVSLVVGEISSRNYRITADGKSTGAPTFITLDPEDEDVIFEILDTNGKALAFEDIKEKDILNIFESRDDENNLYQKIIVSSDKLEGTVSEKNNSDNEYRIGDSYYTSVANINVGDNGIFYVDMYNVILKYDLSGSNRTFGMVYASYKDNNGLDEEAKTVIYTTEGKFETYGYYKNVKLNSVTVTKDDIYNAIANDDYTVQGKTIAAGNLVMYVTNSSNQITEIYTPDYIATKTSNDYKLQDYSTGNSYRASNSRLGSTYLTDSSKIIANKKADNTVDFDKEDISLTNSSIFNEDEINYKFQAIVDKNKNVIVAIVYDSFAKADKSSDVMFVTSVGSTTDSEGSSAVAITGVVKEETVKIVVTSDTYIEDIKGNKITSDFEDLFSRGDVIQYNGTDEVNAVRVLLTASQVANYSNATDGLNWGEDSANPFDEDNDAYGFLIGGVVEEITGGTITFDIPASENYQGNEVYMSTSTPTMLVRINSGSPNTVNRVYTSRLSFDLVETNDVNYGTNDDILIVYKYDDDSLFAVIVDVDGDTKF